VESADSNRGQPVLPVSPSVAGAGCSGPTGFARHTVPKYLAQCGSRELSHLSGVAEFLRGKTSRLASSAFHSDSKPSARRSVGAAYRLVASALSGVCIQSDQPWCYQRVFAQRHRRAWLTCRDSFRLPFSALCQACRRGLRLRRLRCGRPERVNYPLCE